MCDEAVEVLDAIGVTTEAATGDGSGASRVVGVLTAVSFAIIGSITLT